MSDDSTNNNDELPDESLFMKEMADVTPLKPANKIKHPVKKVTIARRTEDNDLHETIDDVFSDLEIIEDCPNILSFSRSGLQHKVIKNLRQGKFTIEHVLDLHGLTVVEARKELLIFLSECEATGIRHAIIVHGKGFRSKEKPVIKPMLNRWLRAVNNVLAFHSAQPKDGGNGAVYVLLKKSLDNSENIAE